MAKSRSNPRQPRRARVRGEPRWEEQLERALESDDRPIVAVVSMDPAGETGECGLCVWGRQDWYFVDASVGSEQQRPDAAPRAHLPRLWSGNPLSAAAFMWLGTEVAAACRQAERVLFVAESDAFGPSVARKLGIGIGALQGLLLDLNAIPPKSRVDVASVTWRDACGVSGHGRTSLKARACELAKPYTGGKLVADHAAEALHLNRFIQAELNKRGVIYKRGVI